MIKDIWPMLMGVGKKGRVENRVCLALVLGVSGDTRSRACVPGPRKSCHREQALRMTASHPHLEDPGPAQNFRPLSPLSASFFECERLWTWTRKVIGLWLSERFSVQR